MATIVNLQEVTKDYGQGQALTHALRGVNLVIEAGEFTAMAGPSGSGKSTLQVNYDLHNFPYRS